MINKNVMFRIAMVFLFGNTVFAAPNHGDEDKEFDVNSVVYIEEEPVIELGFDVKEYLPEGFDPYKFYVDFDTIAYIEDQEEIEFDSTAYLPKDFDAYAAPKSAEGIVFAEMNDTVELGFNVNAYLPEGFDPYKKVN